MHNDDPTLHHERPALENMHGTWSSFYSVFLVSTHDDALRQSVPSILMYNAISARSKSSGSADWDYQMVL
jgi:cellobiose phosphorylase